MFRCDRCGSRFNPLRAAAMENCPRCRIRDEIWTPLTFAPFSRGSMEVDEAVADQPEEARDRLDEDSA